MHFRFVNSKGETVVLPTRVRRADDHTEVYAHGAIGGPLANYHFRIDFYQDIFPPQDVVVTVEGKLQDESITEIERRIVSSVYIPLPFLKELKNWLDKHIGTLEEEYGEIQLPKAEKADEKETVITEEAEA